MSYLDTLPGPLAQQIRDVIDMMPESESVFSDLYAYAIGVNADSDLKRKKVANDTSENGKVISLAGYDKALELTDVSVISPLRKKLKFVIACKNNQRILALTKSTDDPSIMPEFVLNDFTDKNVTLAVILPTPEKKNVKLLAIFYKEQSFAPQFKNEPMLIQLNMDLLSQQFAAVLEKSKFADFEVYLQKQFQMFGSTLQRPFSNGPSSFFVQAYKGSKEGTLYFLPDQIIFGFKKPILLYNSTQIESIGYTSITRVTFNATLQLVNGDKCEFSMIDQSEYEKINQYVQNKEFKDRSMAEEYKAQSKMKNNDSEGILSQMTGEGGVQIADENADSDDEEEDGNYQFGAEESDASAGSGSSGDEDSDDAGSDSNASDDDESLSGDNLESGAEEDDSEIEE